MNKDLKIIAVSLACFFAVPAILFYAVANGQPWPRVPRWNSAPALSTTATAPSGTPQPELPAQLPSRSVGQSSKVAGALHLNGCISYQVTVCAPTGATLSGGGTVDIFSWPDFMPSTVVGLTTWPKNPGLAETLSATTRCQIFPSHSATGLGWIYAVPNAVTLSSGSTVNVFIEAVCSQ